MARLENIEPDESSHPSHGEQPQQFPEKQSSWEPPLQSQGVVQLPFQAVQAGLQMMLPDQMNGNGTATVTNPVVGAPWSTGLFDCQQDPHNAFVTALLPCITFGQIAEVLDSGDMECPLAGYIYLAMMPALCSHWLIGSKYRRKLRRRFNLVEAPFPDVVSHIFCSWCALAQEFRELHRRGLDPSLGWNGILDQMDQTGNPPPRQSMTRS
ncbi:hypothetical protein MLD38_004878 [Melastoma candidum]|uniref:Uncharacterized protein n=1 Tax=Melastoma candidum TaxID=119954 RepID=A0ACB9S744_9MYRT|nr:hypothetical protein MLD38_004878 [Melastoma candidum]